MEEKREKKTVKENLKTRVSDEDVEIGRRLRAARLLAGLSLNQVGKLLSPSLTYQQIQKYEYGKNRVSAVRMRQFCRIYKKPYEYFLDCLEGYSPLHTELINQRFALEGEFFSKSMLKYKKLLKAYAELPDAFQIIALEHTRRMAKALNEEAVGKK